MNDVAGAMERLLVNWAVLTPTVTRLLDPGVLSHLETLVLAGEAVQERDLARWSSDVDQKRILICYGYGTHVQHLENIFCSSTDLSFFL